MRTLKLKDDEGREWIVLHNGDWSGAATIRRYVNDRLVEHHIIPGRIIQKACANAVASEIISMIEGKFC